MDGLTPEHAAKLAQIALGHVALEYPTAAGEVLDAPADTKHEPSSFHPIFYGSYDWHSCVHGYWLLARLNRLFPDLPQRDAIVAQFDRALTSAKAAGERAFFDRPYEEAFERPYGWTWLMKLTAELRLYPGRPWAAALDPLARDLAGRFGFYLKRLAHPVQDGAHNNTALSLILAADYAEADGDKPLLTLMRQRTLAWYGEDVAEPHDDYGGTDFLSAAFVKAEAMRRLLTPTAFQAWFRRYLPRLAEAEPRILFTPAIVADRTDGRLGHLDGVNLTRAWAMDNLARTVDAPRAKVLRDTARVHRAAALDNVKGHYMSEHWLSTYALLALEAASPK